MSRVLGLFHVGFKLPVNEWGEIQISHDTFNPAEITQTQPEPDAALKSCPFCGGGAERVDIEEEGDNFGGSCISCMRCGASSPVHFDRKENLESSWNDRVKNA